MPHFSQRLLVFAAALGGFVGAWAGEEPGAALQELSGRPAHPFAAGAPGFLVFLFVRSDCPVANTYAPEIQRLAKDWAARHVTFRLVYGAGEDSAKAIRAHLSDYGYSLKAYRDPGNAFARQSKVTITPEAAIYRADGKLLYHGRIDDRFAALGQARPAATVHDLAEALRAVTAGKRAPAAAGPAVGCFIEGP